MSLLSFILLATTLSIPSTTLILKSGHRFEIEGPIQQEATRVVFREARGSLYSIPLDEIDMEATRAVPLQPVTVRAEPERRMRLSDAERARLIRELEQNHSGQPPAEQQLFREPPPPRPRADIEQEESDEWSWRRQARAYEEGMRRAKEDQELLLARIEALRSQIRGFISLGYRPAQFTYQTEQLQYLLDHAPQTELNVLRAQRAYDEFRDEARKRGVLPGWLR